MRRLLSISAALLLSLGAAEAAGRAGTTNMTFAASHGTQIEYLGRDGRTFLWYPGNRVVLRGMWRAASYRTPAGAVPGLCFRYGADTTNPATGATGGQWECEPLAVYRRSLVESVPGDVFGLSRTMAPPFDLPREPTTLAALRARMR